MIGHKDTKTRRFVWIGILLCLSAFVAKLCTAAIFINSFNSGQLSKDLKIRADLERHTMGSETLQNILVRPQGMAYKRPGTEYIDTRITDINIPTTTTTTTTTNLGIVNANNARVQWYDLNYTLVKETILTGSNGTCVEFDDSNNTIVGGDTDSGAIWKFDSDLNAVANFYQPTAGWPASAVIQTLRLTDDFAYLYAVADYGTWGVLYKFDNATGLEEWSSAINGLGSATYGMALDSSDNVYVPWGALPNKGVRMYDSSGTLTTQYLAASSSSVYSYDVCLNEGLDRLYAAGQNLDDAPDTGLGSWILSSTGTPARQAYFSAGNGQVMYCVKTDGTNVYACGTRSLTGGFGGVAATVFKLTSELVLVASYDTGSQGSYLCFDANDMLVVKDKTQQKFFILDPSDMSLVESFSYTDRGDSGGGEIYWRTKTETTTVTTYEIWTFDNGAKHGIRLLPFEHYTADADVLEFGHRYIGFLRTTP